MLADEVGLGKTVEAGLVLAQLAAEGKGARAHPRARPRCARSGATSCARQVRARRPRWSTATRVREKERQGLRTNPFDTGGIVICSHPFAAMRAGGASSGSPGTSRSSTRPTGCGTPTGATTGPARRSARRCAAAPKLLLTATPLQNDLMELLGLAAFIDDALLGNEEAFRRPVRHRRARPRTKAADLKARLAPVVVRTLRRQVREYVKFTARRSIVEDFAPTAQEQELYDRVSEYLRRDDAYAIPQARRALFVLVYRKILASSSFALAATLDRLADGLDAEARGGRVLRAGGPAPRDRRVRRGGGGAVRRRRPARSPRAPAGGLRDGRRSSPSCARARGSPATIKVNAKGDALVRGLDRASPSRRPAAWPEKAVVFTEFRRTQDYLARLLAAKGYTVTCLSGDVSAAPTSGRRSWRSSATGRRSCS